MFFARKDDKKTIVGREASFEGNLELKGSVDVLGRFEGTLVAEGTVTVGPFASVTGAITGDVVTIAGKVEGLVVARSDLNVLKTGQVAGDVFYEALSVEAGGVVDGKMRNEQQKPKRLSAEVAADKELLERTPPPKSEVQTKVDRASTKPVDAQTKAAGTKVGQTKVA